MFVPDETDLKILSFLQDNSRTPFKKIAKKVGVSEATVYNRVKRMEQEGFIQKYTVKLNLESFENTWFTALIRVRLNSGKYVPEVSNLLKKMPYVHALYDVTGDYDFVLLTRFSSHKELFGFIRELSAIEHVAQTNSHIVMKVFKEDFSVNFESLKD
ncbi:MAG: Lrp/AsnC family transcriptional regulator [Theionarchaea archaeon]|nr:Lrp/AsnC family transcriptional regulator [Theionarchaea archaeon]